MSTENTNKTISVIGAGAWGTALAQALALSGKEVTLWAREDNVAQSINDSNENKTYLPGTSLSQRIMATSDLSRAASSDILLIVTPAQHVRATLQSMAPTVKDGTCVVLCAKGIEIDTGLPLSKVAAEILPHAQISVLTGPTFAAEIAKGLPSAMTLACADKDAAKALRETLSTKTLRLYVTDDVLGAQIGGAVKNVIAIACGIIHGLGFGESARAALVTRGLAEMGRLASAMGAKRETLMGMCGMGDLMLTCSSMQSRNFSLGAALGGGKSLADILAERKSVTEGVHTAHALITLAQKNAVEMPIAEAVYACLTGAKSVHDIVNDILERPLPEAV
ncbi:MAG: NAD(P)H-dependent glycerol-3-phosphate dehydrogenase [Pseudobdellovibrionaceae bacterium]